MGWFDRLKGEPAAPQVSPGGSAKEAIIRKFWEESGRQPLSEQFASGVAFDVILQDPLAFAIFIKAKDAVNLKLFLTNAYKRYTTNPGSIVMGRTADMLKMAKNDTDPEQWKVEIIELPKGVLGFLLQIPIEHETISERVVSAVIGQGRQIGFYYVYLNKDAKAPAMAIRNMPWQGFREIGKVEGNHAEAIKDFVTKIKIDYYS